MSRGVIQITYPRGLCDRADKPNGDLSTTLVDNIINVVSPYSEYLVPLIVNAITSTGPVMKEHIIIW